MRRSRTSLALAVAVAGLVPPSAAHARDHAPRAAVVVLAGGCYWGVESVYRHVRGVSSAVSGFATPAAGGPHAEAVRITYDPARISYSRLLDIFFSVVHDPTQLDRQGPDVGTEYRSIVFVAGAGERSLARKHIDSLTAARVFGRPIVTELDALGAFTPVDESQQDYAEKHPDQPYIVINDAPKLKALARRFPAVFRK